jgi:hypothetical protein
MTSKRDWAIKYLDAKQQPNGSWYSNDGTTRWFNDEGEYHRADGPAVIFHSGDVRWYLNGAIYFFNRWCNKLNIPDEQKLLLRLQYD